MRRTVAVRSSTPARERRGELDRSWAKRKEGVFAEGADPARWRRVGELDRRWEREANKGEESATSEPDRRNREVVLREELAIWIIAVDNRATRFASPALHL